MEVDTKISVTIPYKYIQRFESAKNNLRSYFSNKEGEINFKDLAEKSGVKIEDLQSLLKNESSKLDLSLNLEDIHRKLLAYVTSEQYCIKDSVNERLTQRNEILGDLSPYWNKTIEEESTDLEEDEITSENDDEYNNAILEEW